MIKWLLAADGAKLQARGSSGQSHAVCKIKGLLAADGAQAQAGFFFIFHFLFHLILPLSQISNTTPVFS